MKKIRLLLAIIALAVASLQGYSRDTGLVLDPVFKDGKVWEMLAKLIDGSVLPAFSCEIVGDTIARDKPCKKLVYIFDGVEYADHAEAWFETDNMIYLKGAGENEEMYYDLGSSIGDTYPGLGEVLSVRHITICGVERRVVEVNRRFRYDNERDYWIEGVGPVYGTLCEPQPRPGVSKLDYYITKACYEDGRKIFDLEEFEQTMKEILAIEGVECDVDDSNEPVYDLFGRRVAKPVPGQIYLRKGKKFVVTE